MTDGKDLRTQLEETLARNKEQAAIIRSLTVRELLRTPTYNLVTEGDLAEVTIDELEERAKEAQQRNADQLKQRLAASGLDDDQIAKVLTGEKLEKSTGSPVGALGRHQSHSGATAPPPVENTNLHGRQALKAHFTKGS